METTLLKVDMNLEGIQYFFSNVVKRKKDCKAAPCLKSLASKLAQMEARLEVISQRYDSSNAVKAVFFCAEGLPPVRIVGFRFFFRMLFQLTMTLIRYRGAAKNSNSFNFSNVSLSLRCLLLNLEPRLADPLKRVE